MDHLLLPPPKASIELEGVFSLDADTLIVLPAHAPDRSFMCAKQLQDDIRLSTRRLTPPGLRVAIIRAFSPPRMSNAILLVCGPAEADAFGVPTWSPDVSGPAHQQSYRLRIAPSGVIAYADGQAGLHYAVQTLRQLVCCCGPTVPACEIRDWPTLVYRGLMLDVSRGKVPTLATLRHLVEELSHYKLNVLQLYTEHTFQYLHHPKIGAGCGSLSSQDIVELDAFCRRHHVELMPNLQSFGHARNTLEIPEYRHLAETEDLWTLSPAFDGTYTLLDEMFADMLPSFTSTDFNIGCDETWDLGKGASKAEADRIGVGRVYLNHILRARDLASRYGCRLQIWGDILLHHPALIHELPDDVVLLDWHYGPQPEYPTTRVFGEAGRRFWVCPGTGSWNSIFPRLYGSNVNIRNLVRDGVAAGAEGTLNTDWGDHGHYQAMGLSWYGYVFGAAQGWTGGTLSDDAFDSCFGPLFFGVDHERITRALRQLAQTNDLPGMHHSNRSHTVLALFDEPLVGTTVAGENALPRETLAQMQSLSEEAAQTCDALAPGHQRELTLREMASAGRLTGYAARKVSLGQEIRAALADIDLSPERIYGYECALNALDIELERLRAEFEALWLARARPSEIHIALGYFAALRLRFRTAVAWLARQRLALQEGHAVDAELATYDDGGYRTLWQTWRRPG